MRRSRSRNESRGQATRNQQRLAATPESSLLQVLRKAGRPLRLDELQAMLGPAAAAQVEDVAARLVLRGDVVQNRRGQYCLREQLPGLVVGTVSAHRNGDGWLMPDDATASVYLPSQQLREVMHGDRVAVRVEGPGSAVVRRA